MGGNDNEMASKQLSHQAILQADLLVRALRREFSPVDMPCAELVERLEETIAKYRKG